MQKAKTKTERAAAAKAVWWDVYKFAASPKFVGRVEAHDEAEALMKAFVDFGIPQHEQFRVTVRQD
jgi:hypothetical protein